MSFSILTYLLCPKQIIQQEQNNNYLLLIAPLVTVISTYMGYLYGQRKIVNMIKKVKFEVPKLNEIPLINQNLKLVDYDSDSESESDSDSDMDIIPLIEAS